MISRSLRAVAAWSHLHRAHFEWVWDGDNVWIVQLDFLAPRTNGVQTDSLVSREQRPSFTADLLSSFFVAGESKFEAYLKLKNAMISGKLGYAMPQFFVLRDTDSISLVFSKVRLPKS